MNKQKTQPCTRTRLWCVCAFVTICSLSLSADATQPGSIEWIERFNSTGRAPTVGTAIAADSAGNIYAAGWVGGALPGQTGAPPVGAFLRKYSSSGAEVWTRQFGSSGPGGDQALAVTVDASGVYVGGLTGAALPGQSSAGGGDAFVRKYDTDGNELWTRQFGTSGTDQVQGLFADANGIYVVGVAGTALPAKTSAGGTDAFVRRYDSGGVEVWTVQFGTTGNDRAFGVTADASGVYVVGQAGIAPPAGPDAFIRKFDVSGSELWARQFGGLSAAGQPLGPDSVLAVSVEPSGVYIAGTVGFRLPDQPPLDASNAFVRKYDGAGTEIWTRQFTTVGVDSATALSVDASGVYVTGTVATALTGQTSAGQSDAYVRRYDLDGLELWTRQFGTGGADAGAGVVATPAGIFVSGSVGGALAGHTATGSPDAFVRGYDVAGNELWTDQFGTTWRQDDTVRGVAVHGQVYAASSFGVTVPFQQTVGGGFLRAYSPEGTELWIRRISTDLPMPVSALGVAGVAADASGVYVVGDVIGALPGQTNVGGIDVYVRKYDASGTEQWTRQFGTSASLDSARGVAVDGTGVYVVGWVSVMALPGQVNSGQTDAYIRKYSPDGVELWTRQFGTTLVDQGLAVAAGPTGVFVVGSTSGTFAAQLSAGSTDAFVRAYDANGMELWTAQFGTSGVDQAFGVAADATGIYVAGAVNGQVLPAGPPTDRQAFVRKFSTSGVELWTREFGTGDADRAAAVAASTRGVFVAGFIGPNGEVRKFDSDGNEGWVSTLVTSDNVLSPLAVAADASGPYAGGFAGGSLDAFRGAFVARLADFTPVSVDIKPGDSVNSVKLGSNGNVPVAILSSAGFDAASVDPASITLENAAVRLRGNGTPMAVLNDVNGDGLLDLVVHVATHALTLTGADAEAELRGETFSGEPIRGTDTVRVIP